MIKLICLDMDGVLVEPHNFWMALHDAYGTLEEGKLLTEKYLKTDYNKLVEEVIGRLWKGKPEAPFQELVENTPYIKGIKEFFATLDTITAERIIISGGNYHLAKRVQKDFGITAIFANKLLFKNGVIEGTENFMTVTGEGTKAKAVVIKKWCEEKNISLEDVLYIGDSGIDIEAFKIVGTAIAFNTDHVKLKQAADFIVDSDDLRDVIPILEKLR